MLYWFIINKSNRFWDAKGLGDFMTLDFFYNNYDLKSLDIKKVEIKDNKLIIDVIVNAHLELIANGYRPELEVDHDIVFTFNYEGLNKVYKNPKIYEFSYNDNALTIVINEDKLIIKDNIVIVKQNS